MECSVAQTLDLVGDWWTLLILRDALFGARRFGDFERNLGIAKNILTNRLRHLVDHEILERSETDDGKVEYRMTERGRDLATVLTALREWGDKWIYGRGNEPLVLVDKADGRRVRGLAVLNADGEPVLPRQLAAKPGRGASPELAERIAQADAYRASRRSRTR